MAHTVRSGSLSYAEAADSLALAAIRDGVLDQLDDQQFLALRERLEQSLVQATIDIEDRAAEHIRKAIEPAISRRYPREVILSVARLENLLAPWGLGGLQGVRVARLPEAAVEEICRQEVRKALQDRRLSRAG